MCVLGQVLKIIVSSYPCINFRPSHSRRKPTILITHTHVSHRASAFTKSLKHGSSITFSSPLATHKTKVWILNITNETTHRFRCHRTWGWTMGNYACTCVLDHLSISSDTVVPPSSALAKSPKQAVTNKIKPCIVDRTLHTYTRLDESPISMAEHEIGAWQ